MKLRNLLVCATLFLIAGDGFGLGEVCAQDCVGFVPVLTTDNPEVSDKTLRTMLLKTQQIVTRNGVGVTALGSAFVIYPKLNVLSKDRIEGGMKAVIKVEGEYSIFVQNVLDNSFYGSVTIPVTGSGFSEQEAFTTMVQNVKATDPQIARFIINTTAKIMKYYTDNCGLVIKNAATLSAQSKYEEALAFLNAVPICVPCYGQASDAVVTTFKRFSDKQCAQLIQMADRYYAGKDYEAALEMVMQINPESSCAGEAKAMIERIRVAVDAQDKTKAAQLKYIFDEQNKMESQQIKAAAEVAKAYYSQKIEANFFVF